MKDDSPIRWRALPESQLVWRAWEDTRGQGELQTLSVVYCLPSDDTHLMNDLGEAIIHLLQEEPLSISELRERLASEYFPAPELIDLVPAHQIERFVHQMTLSGMIFEEKEEFPCG